MMKLFETARDKETSELVTMVTLSGQMLLDYPLLNKGTAFTEEERVDLGLRGLLPAHVSTMQEQLKRRYDSYQQKNSDIEKYIYLTSLQDRNETLFYRFLQEHISEMMPIIYTPVVGQACQQYSHNYRRPRGLYIDYAHRDDIDTILNNATSPDIKIIVVTDGERILGLGDLGVGGIGIPIGKLSLYTLCAGIHPASTLPIILDVGTDNPSLYDDPLYIGWHHHRVRGQEYDDFIETFVAAVMRRFPNVLLQWEDFAKNNAERLLERYHDRLCTFNDDIQGTGAVTLAGLMAAMSVIESTWRKQQIVILGAGSAANGVSDQIVSAMMSEGLSQAEAKSRIWLVDSQGLVHSSRPGLNERFKQQFAQPLERLSGWKVGDKERISLAEVVAHVKPTILIGAAAQPASFTEQIVREMAGHTERPIIFPLSNPTSKCEAKPADLIAWTEGRALIATGSPFAPVSFGGRSIQIGQCNNAFIFPGVGLGVIAANARRVTTPMFVAAAGVLSELSPARKDSSASLFPALEDVRFVSKRVAAAVAHEAQRAGLAEPCSEAELAKRIDASIWQPEYIPMRCR